MQYHPLPEGLKAVRIKGYDRRPRDQGSSFRASWRVMFQHTQPCFHVRELASFTVIFHAMLMCVVCAAGLQCSTPFASERARLTPFYSPSAHA